MFIASNFSNQKIDEDLQSFMLLCMIVSHQQCSIPAPGKHQYFLYFGLKTQLCVSVLNKKHSMNSMVLYKINWIFRQRVLFSHKKYYFTLTHHMIMGTNFKEPHLITILPQNHSRQDKTQQQFKCFSNTTEKNAVFFSL